MTDYRLAMVDVDGTLRSTEGWLPGALDMLQALSAAGLRLAVCSGRPVHSLEDLFAGRPEVGHLSGAGGSVVERREPDGSWTLLLERHLSDDDVRRAVAACDDLDLELWAYTATEWLVTGASPMAEREKRILGGSGFTVVDTFVGRTDLLKVLTIPTRPDQPDALARALEAADVALVASNETYLDVVPMGSQRTKGGDALVDDLGIDWSQVVAIGDGPNDTGMLGLAGLGIALGPELSAEQVLAANPAAQGRTVSASDRLDVVRQLPDLLAQQP